MCRMMCHADTSQATCSSFGITGFSLIAIDKVTSNKFKLELITCGGFQLAVCTINLIFLIMQESHILSNTRI